MSYSRFALGFTGKRRVAALSDGAFRLWVSAIDYSRDQLTDGRIELLDLKLIPRGGSGEWQTKHVRELVESGLWVQIGDSVWAIDDYDGWQDSSQKVREKREKARSRMKDVRANKTRTKSEQHANVRDVFARSSREVRSGRVLYPLSSISSQGGVGGSGGSGEPEVFDAAHPEFDEPPPPTQPLNAKPAESLVVESPVPVVEETPLQRAARRILAGGGQAQNARFERGPVTRWPEVKRVLELDLQLRGDSDYPRTDSDGRILRTLERYAEGFTPDELEDVVRRAHADEFWRSQGLHTVLKEPANFSVIGRSRPRRGGDEPTRPPGTPIVLSTAEAAKWS